MKSQNWDAPLEILGDVRMTIPSFFLVTDLCFSDVFQHYAISTLIVHDCAQIQHDKAVKTSQFSHIFSYGFTARTLTSSTKLQRSGSFTNESRNLGPQVKPVFFLGEITSFMRGYKPSCLTIQLNQ